VKPRGKLARIETLEEQAQRRLIQVEAVKVAVTERAMMGVSSEDRAALYEHLDAQEAGSAWFAEVCRASRALEGPPIGHPAGESTRAWLQALDDTPEGQDDPIPPAGAVAYLSLEAARCDTMLEYVYGVSFPDGVSLPAAQAAARWSAAWWRYEAAYARQLGEAAA